MTDYYLTFYEIGKTDDEAVMSARFTQRTSNGDCNGAARSVLEQLPRWNYGPLVANPHYIN